MNEKELAQLAGEYLHARGMRVEKTGIGTGKVIDLVARKGGESWLVQCRPWKGRDIDVSVVRELGEAIASRAAHGGYIFTNGRFTWDAMVLGEEIGIVLVDGQELAELSPGDDGAAKATVPEAGFGAQQQSRSVLKFLFVVPVLALAIVAALIYFDVLTLKDTLVSPKPVVSRIGATPESVTQPLDKAPERDLLAEFDAQYEPPEECRHWQSEQQMVDCANRRIRAYKEFERSQGQ